MTASGEFLLAVDNAVPSPSRVRGNPDMTAELWRAALSRQGRQSGRARSWLHDRRLPTRTLYGPAGDAVALVTEPFDARPGPTYCLNACLDTAPFGDLASWMRRPTSGDIADGVLFGRGAADSKTGAAIFAHLGIEFAAGGSALAGRLLILFDADEHTGRFGGAREFLDTYKPIDGVMIGYPGKDSVIVGARGFYRARITVQAFGGHSGSTSERGPSAVEKAARLVRRLGEARLPQILDPEFPLPPRLTVTAIHGGVGFSTIPDRCDVSVDVRLTPGFGQDEAGRLLQEVVAAVDEEQPTRLPNPN